MGDQTLSSTDLPSRAARARQAWRQVGLHIQTVTPRALLRFMLVIAATAIFIWLLWTSRNVLLPFAIGAGFAYVCAPLVNLLARHLPRGAAIFIVFASALALLGAFVLLLIPTLLDQLRHLAQMLPRSDAMAALAQHIRVAMKLLPRGIRDAIGAGLTQANAALKANLATIVHQIVAVIGALVFNVFHAILYLLGFAVVPIWLYYLLQSAPSQRAAVYGVLPAPIRADALAMLRIIDRVFSAWIRGQIVLSLFLAIGVYVGLTLLQILGVKGIPNTLLLAVFAAVVAPIPYVGNYLAVIPAVVSVLFISWQGAVAVLIFYVILENVHINVVSPKVMSKELNIDPAILMPLMIVLGGFGLIWLILAGPLAAVSRDLFTYAYGRLSEPPRAAGLCPGDTAAPSTTGRVPGDTATPQTGLHAGEATRRHDIARTDADSVR